MAVERRLGWDTIPSPRFRIERVASGYRFQGGGFGHGIGLCLAGATERARRGASRDEILGTYFPRARVVPLHDVRPSV
jgi:SpoIID/LytB domain protein